MSQRTNNWLCATFDTNRMASAFQNEHKSSLLMAYCHYCQPKRGSQPRTCVTTPGNLRSESVPVVGSCTVYIRISCLRIASSPQCSVHDVNIGHATDFQQGSDWCCDWERVPPEDGKGRSRKEEKRENHCHQSRPRSWKSVFWFGFAASDIKQIVRKWPPYCDSRRRYAEHENVIRGG